MREDRCGLPPRNGQHTLAELVERFETFGLTRIEAMMRPSSNFPGTELSRPAYVLAAARDLRHVGIEVLQDVHAVGRHSVGCALGNLPGNGEAVAHRVLTYTAHDDWVLADEPVCAFVRAATGTAEVSGRRARDLVRKAVGAKNAAPGL